MRARTLPLLLLATVAVLLSALPVTAQSAPRFGPKQYVRVVGWPQTFTETFPNCARGTRQFLSHTTTLRGGPCSFPPSPLVVCASKIYSADGSRHCYGIITLTRAKGAFGGCLLFRVRQLLVRPMSSVRVILWPSALAYTGFLLTGQGSELSTVSQLPKHASER